MVLYLSMRAHNNLFYYITLFSLFQYLTRAKNKEKIDKSINFYLIRFFAYRMDKKKRGREGGWKKKTQQKRHTAWYVFPLVDDQGAFAALKENLQFSEPLGSRPCL